MQNWNELIIAITEDLNSRKLRQPNRRQSALLKIDSLMRKHFDAIIKNPNILGTIPKVDFKTQIAKIEKVKRLNGAEDSISNNIYHKLGIK
jgi:hypothetical protein